MRRDPGRVFDALGDPTRREVVAHLARLGSASPTQIAETLPISRQAVSKHLAALADAGLVTFERSGRETRYRITPGPLTDAVSWMVSVGSDWDRRLESLGRHLRRRR
jgi:DNA-binding transcriptional ArsR family regulator